MKLVRSDSPEVIDDIAPARVRVTRRLPMLLLGLLPNLLIIPTSLAALILSWRAAVCIGVPAFLAWNAWVLWRARSPRLSWVVRARHERIYIRLFAGFGRVWRESGGPDVLMFEASEVASMSIRTIEVFLDGPKPKIVDWLMIEPSSTITENLSGQIPSFLEEIRTPDLSERVYWASEERRLAVGWKWCRPALRVFLQQIVRECPSIGIGPEEHSELDLNGIWSNRRRNLDTEERQKLARAVRLGFFCACAGLVSRYKHLSFRKAGACLAEIRRAEIAKQTLPPL
jgi:hypothetical protein